MIISVCVCVCVCISTITSQNVYTVVSLASKQMRSWHEAPSYFIHVHSLPLASLLMPFRLSNLLRQKGLGCAKVIHHVASKQPIISFTPGTCTYDSTETQHSAVQLKDLKTSNCCTTSSRSSTADCMQRFQPYGQDTSLPAFRSHSACPEQAGLSAIAAEFVAIIG